MYRLKNLPAQLLAQSSIGRDFRPKAEYHDEAEQILIINRSPSSTVEIYLRPRFVNSIIPVTYVDFPNQHPSSIYFKKKTFVIISRYINKPWCKALKKYRDIISGIAYLMDDDIPEAGFDHTLPPGYALGLAWFFQKYWKSLQNLCNELWVCSTYLIEKYNGPATHLIDPIFVTKPSKAALDNGPLTIFYHAQRPHYEDKLWLKEIIIEIQKRYEHTLFEIFGGYKIIKAYRTVPRTRVLKRLIWPDYLDYCYGLNYDIGLAPLSGGEFNKARSINKLFDISRCGAAGIYADSEPYSSVIDEGNTGVLCSNTPEAWIGAISDLIDNKNLRKKIYNNCFKFCENHNQRASTPNSLTNLLK